MRIFRAFLAAPALLAIVSATSPAAAQQGGRQIMATVVGDAVREEAASQTAEVVGRFVALRGGPIAARVAGAVDDVLVDVGDRVESGQALARLALDRLTAERERRRALVNLAAARIRSAKASLGLAEQNAQRLARLRNSAAFSEALLADKQREAEGAAADVREAEADYARAQAELKLAEVDLAYAEVQAPYSGVVAERHVDIGGFVALGAPVVTLVGDEAMEIEAEAPTDWIVDVRPGAMADVRYGGVAASAPLRATVPRETGVSRTRTVRFGPLPPNLARVAIANAAVAVAIPISGAGAVVTVHKDAIIRRPEGAVVVVAKPKPDAPGEYLAEFRPVELGGAVGGRFIVTKGAAPGDVVVVRGNETLRPGQTFKLAGSG